MLGDVIHVNHQTFFMCFRNDFLKHKSDIAKQALNSRSGRPIPVKDIEQYQQLEQKKDHEVMLVRMQPRTQALHCFYRDQWRLIMHGRQNACMHAWQTKNTLKSSLTSLLVGDFVSYSALYTLAESVLASL